MNEEKKNLSLSDLGLDESSNPTPADIAEKKETEKKEKSSIKRGLQTFKPIGDINKFLGREPVDNNPIRNTLDTMYELVDEGIERTKQDLKKPGGRIEQAKIEYIKYMYPKIMERAKSDSRLKDKIDKLNKIMDSDPRFDNATEIERQGYTIYIIAKKKDIGIDNAYFGIEEEPMGNSKPRLSTDSTRAIDAIVELQKDTDDFKFDDEDFVSLGTNKTNEDIVPTNLNGESEKPDVSKAKVDQVKMDNEIPSLIVDEDEPIDGEDAEPEEDTMSDEQMKAIQKEYKEQLIKELRLNRIDDLDGFSVESKPIELKAALKPKETAKVGYVWPLLHTGIGVEMTPFDSDEILILNPQNTDFETVQGLNSVFSVLYKHVINQNKPPFETWLRQIYDFDIDQLIFAGHAATFRDTNYLTYECSNSKCKKVFLQKKDIMDMITFPSDEVKDRFNSILSKETVMKQTYTTKPKRISNDYAIGFTSQSIYSNLFEPASLTNEFSKKYATIINIMPNIDVVYKIDQVNRKLYPIRFGVDPSSLSKTVQRKVRALNSIFKTFTPDERAIAIGEAQKISNQMSKWKLSYYIPETTCPHCGQKIERRESNPLNILFTRAQLPIVAAFIQE